MWAREQFGGERALCRWRRYGKGRLVLSDVIVVRRQSSEMIPSAGLIISLNDVILGDVDFTVGSPGLPGIRKSLPVGGAVLFETLGNGLFDVRVFEINSAYSVAFHVAQVSPRRGIAGGLVDQDASNAAFTAEELRRIADSLTSVQLEMGKRTDLQPEQQAFIAGQLDEMKVAAERLGRKDWLNWAVGTLTSIIVTLALSESTGKALMQAAGAALAWLTGGSIKLLH